MDYTPQDYEQDRRIALHIYNKHFKGHFLKDDLVQIAITELWKLRRQQNSRDYVANACDTAHKKMISYLRKENRHRGLDSLNRHVGQDSILRLFDVIAIEQPTPYECCEFRELVNRLLPLQMTLTGKRKQIISLHLKHYTQREIAYRVGTSFQYVSDVVKKFRSLAREILDKD